METSERIVESYVRHVNGKNVNLFVLLSFHVRNSHPAFHVPYVGFDYAL